ncbi:hypothetical protein GJAV_G00124080 [Gymnothorax javanicus]|nr:hypothetical protein GJAV_G00124080 [Gymnothorax javanicus]
MPVIAPLSSRPEFSQSDTSTNVPGNLESEGRREGDRNKGTRERKMPEYKQAMSRSGSYLSGATYRRIKRVLSFRRRVFGQRLEETVVYERRYGEHMAPLVVEQCVAFIREHGLQEVGLFRQPGQATLVKELQEAFDAGEKPSFDGSTDVHTVASLLKLYLRELPEPVVPFSRYQDFLLCGEHILSDRKQGLLELKRLLHDLPLANFNLLHYICRFLNEVQTFSSSNKMSTQNLATVFGPNILRPKAEDPESIIGGTAVVQQLMSELIRECSLLFVREIDSSARPGSSHFSEGVSTGPAAPPNLSCPAPGPTSEVLPPPSLTDETVSPQSTQGEMTNRHSSQTEPRPFCTPSPVVPLYENFLLSRSPTPPPPFTPPLPPPSPPTPPPLPQVLQFPLSPQGGRLHRNEIKEGSGRAKRAGRKASDAHESTLSVYDNMDDGGSGGDGTPEREARSSSAESGSWSSCELPEEDEVAVAAGLLRLLPSRPSLRPELPEDLRVNSPASSAVTDGPLSSGSSEVFLPSAPPDPPGPAPHPSAVHCVLTALRQQMARQKLEYEAQIKSLEQKNEALVTEVSGLRARLEQQRRWYSIAEIKMRNAERARVDADRRNTALQREMEQFFDTFGELNSQTRKAERIAQSF